MGGIRETSAGVRGRKQSRVTKGNVDCSGNLKRLWRLERRWFSEEGRGETGKKIY